MRPPNGIGACGCFGFIDLTFDGAFPLASDFASGCVTSDDDDDDALAEGCAIAAVGLGSRLIDATGVFGRKNESRAASTFLVVPGAGSILWVIGVGGGGVRGDVGIS